MTSSKSARRLLLRLLGFLLLAGFWSCHVGTEESAFMNVKVDSSWTRYDRVAVVLADESGSPLDTLFDGKLATVDQLKKLDADGFDGGKVQVILIGYLEGRVAKRETRPYDGSTGLTGEKIIVVLIPLDPDPADSSALDLQPEAAKLYTGGPSVDLVPSGKGWTPQALAWSSEFPNIATVETGKVKPVSPGRTWIKAATGSLRDSALITVMTDPPLLTAGADTVVLLGDTAVFRIRAEQEFGVFSVFKWSLDGDTLWDGSSDGLPASSAILSAPPARFAKAGTVTLRFLVGDGEGNIATATRDVLVSDPALPVIASVQPGDTTVSIRDSLAFTAQITSRTGLKSYAWDLDGDGKADASGLLSGLSGVATAGRVFPDTGAHALSLKVSDAQGGTTERRITVTVVRDPPVADAGADTTVAAGARITLRGKASDRLGRVAKTEWKIGAGEYAVASPETSFTAPAPGAATLACSFRVTDDDGNISEDGMTVTIRASAVADLRSLAASAGTLSPAFAAGTFAYTVSTAQTSTTVTPTVAAGSNATVKVNGVAVASGGASAAIALPAGEATTVTIEVTAENGALRTYTIAFTVAPAGKPDLVFTAASVTAKTPTRIDYSYAIRNNGTAAIPSLSQVSIQNFYSADTIFNNAGDQAAGGAILALAKALAPGETHTGTFYASGPVPAGHPFLTFKIDWGDTVDESDEANNTRHLRVLVPPVAEAGADTTVAAGTPIRLRGRATDPVGSVARTEWKIGGGTFVAAPPETTFTAPTAGGSLVCTFRAVDDDGLAHEDEMTVTISASADADLSSLVPSVGSLAPAFSRTTQAYTLAVANSVASMTLTPTAASAAATAKVNGVAVASGQASGSLPLAVGSNTLTVEVTAQSGLKKTYTVAVSRAASAVNTLQGLTASAGALSPAFAAGTLAYTVNTSSATTTVTPTVAAGSNATVRVNGVAVASGTPGAAISLPAGATTTVNVVVTAENGTTRTYSIDFVVPGSTLADLVIVGATLTSVTATRFEYSYVIRNAGGSTIPSLSSVSIQNFYSADAIFNNAGDQAAGGAILAINKALAPGESHTGTFAANGAPGAAMNYITWKIDWGDIVEESNESNNTIAIPLP